MNGLFVTLPLLLLLLPSLNASDAPILVLEQTASAVRAPLRSQGVRLKTKGGVGDKRGTDGGVLTAQDSCQL